MLKRTLLAIFSILMLAAPASVQAQTIIGGRGSGGGGGGGGSGYATIKDEGSSLTQRSTVNFVGSLVSCVDNAGSSRTDCTMEWTNGNGIAKSGNTFSLDTVLPDQYHMTGSGTALLIDNNETVTGTITTSGITAGAGNDLAISSFGTTATWKNTGGNIFIKTVTSGNITMTAVGTLTLNSGASSNVNMDSGSSGSVVICNTNCTSLNLSRSGQSTSVQGRLALVQDLVRSGIRIAASTTGTVNDWDTGSSGSLSAASKIRIVMSGATTFTGIVAQVNGKHYRVCNSDTTLSATFKNENAGSSANNRILTPGAADYVLGPKHCMDIDYDTNDNRWSLSGNSQP